MINRIKKWLYVKKDVSSLQLAIENNNSLPLIQSLIKKRANLNHQDPLGKTALHYAVSKQRNDIIAELIKAGANVHLKDENELTPLMQLVSDDKSELATLQAFFKNLTTLEKAKAINEQIVGYSWRGYTPLLIACQETNWVIVKELIDQGADTNHADHEKHTALHYAIAANNITMVQILHEHGASLADPLLLPLAIANNCSSPLIQLLIKECSDINYLYRSDYYSGNLKNTALHHAVSSQRNDIIIELIKAGANIHLKDHNGSTPLMHIIGNEGLGHLETLRTFLKSLSTHERIKALNDDSDDYTPLQIAIRGPRNSQWLYKNNRNRKVVDLEVVKELIEGGADIDHLNTKGHTALYYAIHDGNVALVKTLLDKGADVNLGQPTPLGEAISSSAGKTEIVEMLLEKGADPNQSSQQNKITALGFAIHLFLNKDADPNQLQQNKITPLDLAIKLLLNKCAGFGYDSRTTRYALVNLLLNYGAIITNYEAFYQFLSEEHSELFYFLFLNPSLSNNNYDIELGQLLKHLNETQFIAVIGGYHALFTQLEKQQTSFPHEAKARKNLQELREITVGYRTKIDAAINLTSKTDLPSDITGIMSDYLGYKISLNTSEPEPQKIMQSEDDQPVRSHYPRGKKSYYPFLFSGENNHSTDSKEESMAKNLKITY